MGREQQGGVTKEVGDLTVEVFMLPPKQAMKVLTRLTKVVGQPLGALASGLMGEKPGENAKGLADRDLPPDIIERALVAFTDRLEEDMVTETIDIMFSVVHIQSGDDVGTRPIRMDTDFRGKTLLMLKVFAAALEVNFADFFSAGGGSGGLLAKARAAMATKLGTPTSTSGSGAPS